MRPLDRAADICDTLGALVEEQETRIQDLENEITELESEIDLYRATIDELEEAVADAQHQGNN